MSTSFLSFLKKEMKHKLGSGTGYGFKNDLEILIDYNNYYDSWGNLSSVGGSNVTITGIAEVIASTGAAGTFWIELGNTGYGINVQNNSHLIFNEAILAQAGGPNYYEKSFSEQGYQRSRTISEGVGITGGFWYALNGKIYKDSKGKWYVYAQTSAFAPAAESKADAITYYSKITVLENGNPIETYSGNLQVWDTSIERIGDARYTYIGSGYMPLPTSGGNISIEISISYNMYQWWNGHASPNPPYIYKINF